MRGDLSVLDEALQALSGGNILAPLATLVSLFSSPISFAFKKSTADITIGSPGGQAVTIEGDAGVGILAEARSRAKANAVYYQTQGGDFGFAILALIAEATAKVTIDGGNPGTQTTIRSADGDVLIDALVSTESSGSASVKQNLGSDPLKGIDFPDKPRQYRLLLRGLHHRGHGPHDPRRA